MKDRIEKIATELKKLDIFVDQNETESTLIEKATKASVLDLLKEFNVTPKLTKHGVYTAYPSIQVNKNGLIIAGVNEGKTFDEVFNDHSVDNRPSRSGELETIIYKIMTYQVFGF